jgi:lipoprotein-releasing system permease protein
VLDKKGDITVLHALGADRPFIQRNFLSSGLIIGDIGAALGMILAGGVGWAQQTYHLIPLQGSTFMIDYFPVRMVPEDFFLVGATVLIIALLASFIPARKAARQEFYIRE